MNKTSDNQKKYIKNNIEQLPTAVANRIAAGEVIERPASLIKELIENSIDAGSTDIKIIVENGGVDCITIIDNGRGIVGEELPLAITHHATSKISSIDDLDSIYTLGFRGEALASIADVSRLEIRSKSNLEDNGAHIMVEGGEVKKHAPYPIAEGTTIIVKNLFYNMPARYKFLKSSAAEFLAIKNVFDSFVVSKYNISLSLQHNNGTIYRYSAVSSIKERLHDCLDTSVYKELIEIQTEYDDIKIFGYVSNMNVMQSSRKHTAIFLNGRVIDNRTIAFAIKNAYKGIIPSDKFPYYYIYISLDASKVDVNVHPSKKEVRIKVERDIASLLYKYVLNKLGGSSTLRNSINSVVPPNPYLNTDITQTFDNFHGSSSSLNREIQTHNYSGYMNAVIASNLSSIFNGDSDVSHDNDDNEYNNNSEDSPSAPDYGNYHNDVSYGHGDSGVWYNDSSDVNDNTNINIDINNTSNTQNSISGVTSGFDSSSSENYSASINSTDINSNMSTNTGETLAIGMNTAIQNEFGSSPKVVGQIFFSYIIVEYGDELLIVDFHAAYERLNYELIYRSVCNQRIEYENLLVAFDFEYKDYEIDLIEEAKGYLKNIGLHFERTGKTTLALYEIPIYLAKARHNETIIKDILNTLIITDENFNRKSPEHFIRKAIERIACRYSPKANDLLSNSELQRLIDTLISYNILLSCPHGRPFVIRMNKEYLDKKFFRI